MFDSLPDVGRELHAQMMGLYWVLLVPLVSFLVVIEFLKDENPSIKDILKRVVISIILLYSIDWVMATITMLSDGVTDKIDGIQKLWDVLKNLGPNYKGSDQWFSLRASVLYFFNVGAYLIAYLGFFVANVLMHFVWTVLYICSPLMILMYVSKKTASITSSLYKGLIQVATWKMLWSLLGVLLLKMALDSKDTGVEDYLMSIVVNLCIGVSMLFIPIFTKSLLNDGLQSAASALAAVPTMAAASAIKGYAMAKGAGAISKGIGAAKFVAKPLTNPATGRYDVLKSRLKPKVDQFKKNYSQLNLPKSALDLKNKNKKGKTI
jgi:hypothetical protein